VTIGNKPSLPARRCRFHGVLRDSFLSKSFHLAYTTLRVSDIDSLRWKRAEKRGTIS